MGSPKTKRRLKSPKAKGDAYERELATFLDDRLFAGGGVVRRAPLSGGGRTFQGAGEADLIGLPHIHVEAKRVERLNVHEAIRQAVRSVLARRSPDIPVVISRRSNVKTEDSIVALRLADFVQIYGLALERVGALPTRTSPPAPVEAEPPLSLVPLNTGDPSPPPASLR